jgi:cytochrome c556
MIRIALVVVAILFDVSVVASQQDPVKTRVDLMKQNDQHLKTLGRMARGQDPFDAAKVNEAFAQWGDTAQKLPALFPTATGDNKRSSPKVWQDKADFQAKIADFAKVIADSKGKAQDQAGLKAAFPLIANSCDNCHDTYRLSAAATP